MTIAEGLRQSLAPFVLILASPVMASAQSLPGPGVPLALAQQRAAAVSDLRYDLHLSVPDGRDAPIAGRMMVRFRLSAADAPLALDFDAGPDHVTSVGVNGTAVPVEVVNGHIMLPARALVAGVNAVAIDFRAGDAALNRTADFLYTLFVPARARLSLPVFDQPDLKGRWSLTLEHPARWVSVANGRELERSTSGGRMTVRFAETPPLPTYLVAFVCGDFRIETAERDGRTFRMFHRESDAARLARNRDAIFDLHARSLAFMEEYTGIPYPFDKFDLVSLPAFQFSGMEHAGKVLYNANTLMLDPSATQNQLLGRASTIAHETAHMWFGDLVTMRWFDDVWMKEVFANFMAAKIVNPSFPEVHHDLRFLLSNYPAAYEVDRTPGANPIRQPLDNLQEAGSLYGSIIYQKAPVVMRHLEAMLGEQPFRDGVRTYLRRYAFGNAEWGDLIAVLDTLTPVDLVQWSRAWVEEPGRPEIATELSVRNGRVVSLAFRQRDPRGQRRLWPQDLRVVVATADGTRTLTVRLEGERVEVPAAAGLPEPRYVLPAGDGWAYGDFVLDAGSLDYLATSVADIEDALTRGSAWVTLWDALLDARLPARRLLDLGLRVLPVESDEQLVARVLGYMSGTWWRFAGEAERTEYAPRLERVLRQGLEAARTASQKGAWFAALRSVAQTPPTLEWLRRVWQQQEVVVGLPLVEADYMTLALDLAVRDVEGARDLVEQQRQRITDPDRRARFEFVAPAVSGDPVERARWFGSLAQVANRRREPWVLEGLSYLHHPLRAAASRQHVARGLEMVWDTQRTGDIFFPKRWLDTMLAGHRSPDVAAMVQSFLENLPTGFPERLKNITLQSSDELFRAAAVARPGR
jgi:aminopeptidase N